MCLTPKERERTMSFCISGEKEESYNTSKFFNSIALKPEKRQHKLSNILDEIVPTEKKSSK